MKKFRTVADVNIRDFKLALLEADRLVRENPELQQVILRRPEEEIWAPSVDWTLDPVRSKYLAGERIYVGGGERNRLAGAFNICGGQFLPVTVPNGLDVFNVKTLADIDSHRQDEVRSLIRMFDRIRGNYLFEAGNLHEPHYDFQDDDERAYEDCLFFGRLVRLLRVRTGSEFCYFADDEGLDIKFISHGSYSKIESVDKSMMKTLRVGDMVVFLGTNWGQKRAQPHTSPEFGEEGAEYTPELGRILDIYDLAGGRNIAQIRQEIMLEHREPA